MKSFPLATVMGIPIRLDASWFVIFLLILWTFTQGVFPETYPGLPAWAYYAMGLVGALLFFASLLAHEMAHALVARRRGVAVEGITLFIFGGMARTRMDSPTPGDEFLIAGVGPLSSLVIGLLFGVVWWVGVHLRVSAGVTGVAEYLAYLNVVLALFNLLPGFPLDGGRLLRSAVWKATGSAQRATRVAAWGGAALAYALMLYGGWVALHGQPLDGAWLVFIGWFVRNAARSGYRQFAVVNAMERAPVWQAMTRWPVTLAPELTLRRAVNEHFLRLHYDAYPVVGADGRALGMLSRSQVQAVPESEWDARTVGEVMTPCAAALQVGPDDSMARVLDRLHGAAAGRLLVTREGRLEGIITPADVAAWLKRSGTLGRI